MAVCGGAICAVLSRGIFQYGVWHHPVPTAAIVFVAGLLVMVWITRPSIAAMRRRLRASA